jgi:hypothetical protein
MNRQPRFLFTGFANKTYRSFTQLRREFLSFWHDSTLSWISSLHQTQGDSLAEGATQGISSSVVRLMLPPQTGTGKAGLLSEQETLRVTASVKNASDELIGPVKLQLVDIGRNEVFDEFCVLTAYIEPAAEYVGDFVFVNPAGPGAQPGLGTTVTFREASGQWWRRHLAEAIERVHDDPENGLHTPTERDQFAANARLFGGTPTPHPSLTKRVRWHRWWRKKRGRSPIP